MTPRVPTAHVPNTQAPNTQAPNTQAPTPTPSRESPRVLSCRTVVGGRFRHYNHIRGLAPVMVEERFGDAEPEVASPSELLLAALGSCLGARIHANAAAASMRVTSLELQVDVDAGVSPLWEPPGTEPRAIGFESIRITVHIDADASPEAIRSLVAHAVLWSPVANTLHDPVHLDVTIGGAG